MEVKLNIVNILKDKPKDTKLYADAFGELSFEYININTICTRTKEGMFYSFYNDGKYNKNGEPILVPSKEMRDWSKFTWKKGDILVSNDYSTEVIFDKWYDDTYTSFYCKHYLNSEDETKFVYHEEFICTTERYAIEDKDKAQIYIGIIEERLGGKLNRETLEVEKAQPEFKDGDIVVIVVRKCTHIAIFQSRQEAYIGFHAVLCQNDELLLEKPFREDVGDIELRLATDSEKQQLFEALAKEGKTWDAVKKQIVDFKPKWMTLKPFDKVITRVDDNAIWTANIFSHMDSYGEYVTIGCVGGYPYCIPYNEETAKLIGTTKEWEE